MTWSDLTVLHRLWKDQPINHARTQNRQDGGPPPPPGRRRVYLVEDDPVERARAAALLERAGFEVVTVPSLEAAATEGFWSGDPAKLVFITPKPPTTPRLNASGDAPGH